MRQSLPEILESVTDATQDLLGDEIVALWLREPGDPDRVRLAAWRGMREEVARRLAPVPLTEAGVAGEAILADGLVTNQGQPSTLTVDLVPGRQTIAMAAPVRESGVVTGALLVASCEPQRQFGDADTQTLRAFAEHVSLALTDAKTVDQMRQAYHDSLTGLATRGLFLERLTQQLSLAAREGVGVATALDLAHLPLWLFHTSPLGQLGVLAPLPPLPPPLAAKATGAPSAKTAGMMGDVGWPPATKL